MVDDADLIEKYEGKLWDIICRMHKDGVRYKVTYGILQEIVESLDMMGYCEDWLNQYNKKTKP